MKWCKSFFFVFCFVFASSGFAEPPKLDDLKKLVLFLQNEIFAHGSSDEWSRWAVKNSYVSEKENFSWSNYYCKDWRFEEEDLTLEVCNQALQLFRRKQGIERWDQEDLSFISDQGRLTELLDDVGVRAKISNIADSGAKYDWAIIPGGALFRVESRINCLSELYSNKQVEKFIVAGADRVLSKVDKKDELLSGITNHEVEQVLYGSVEKYIKTEMDGMFFMAMLMLEPDFDCSSTTQAAAYCRSPQTATDWRNHVLRDLVCQELINKSCQPVSDRPAKKMTMQVSYAQGRDGNRATTKDNVAAICNDNPDIAAKKLALLSTQPHAHYQEEIFKKEFNKMTNRKKVDITVFALPIDDRILVIEQLNAVHQWLQESLSSS